MTRRHTMVGGERRVTSSGKSWGSCQSSLSIAQNISLPMFGGTGWELGEIFLCNTKIFSQYYASKTPTIISV